MTFISVVLSLFWLILIPMLAGSGIVAAGNTFGKFRKIIFSWLFGQLLLWCAFQCIAVYHIIKEHPYSSIEKHFIIATIAICVVSVAVMVPVTIKKMLTARKQRNNSAMVTGTMNEMLTNTIKDMATWEKVISIIVILGLIAQIVLQIVLAYYEVDDSFYVSEATTAQGDAILYHHVAYTGVGNLFDIRHGLAPFPVWLAAISHLSKVRVVTMAHVVIPAVHLLITYVVYALFGSILLGEEKKKHLPVFMLFTEILVTFGFYSYMTPEKFFMTRLREGKATLASLILPGIIMCLFMILQNLKEDKKTDLRLYILLLVLNGAGCLCSTMGAILCAMPIFICAVFAAIIFKKARHLLPMALSCLPCVGFALQYITLT